MSRAAAASRAPEPPVAAATVRLRADREQVLARGALALVVLLAALLESWRLTIDGYGNGYYAEAALAASRSWGAMLRDAADPSGLVSLDKGPLPDWVLGLSARVLGFGHLSVLLPSALFAVAAVVVLHDALRRTLGRRTALLGALMLALSPVSVLMGRYDNPDPLLALLLTGSAWALIRALESGRTRHVALAGLLVALGFNAKMLEAYLILPALGLAFLTAAPGPLRARLRQLGAAGGAMLALSLAWYATMTLLPAGERPYVAESTDNSWLQLIAQANGLKRITGFPGRDRTGPLRLFAGDIAGQASWLAPLALLGLLVGLAMRRGRPRTDLGRAGLVLFGTWMLVGWAVFSFSRGLFHAYYTSAIMPAVAALAAAAVTMAAERLRTSRAAAAALAGGVAGTALLAWSILGHTPAFAPWLRWLVLAAGALAALGVGALRLPSGRGARLALGVPTALCAMLALLGGPAAYSIATVGFGRSGANPMAGPRSLTPPHGTAARPFDPRLLRYLRANRDGARYILAASGSDFAAPVGLATGAPVVTLGGFDGSNPAPTVAQLAALLRSGQLHFVLLSAPQHSAASRRLAAWVASRCARDEAVPLAGLTGENGSPLGVAAAASTPTAAGGAAAGLYRCRPSGA